MLPTDDGKLFVQAPYNNTARRFLVGVKGMKEVPKSVKNQRKEK